MHCTLYFEFIFGEISFAGLITILSVEHFAPSVMVSHNQIDQKQFPLMYQHHQRSQSITLSKQCLLTNFSYREYHELGNKLYMIVTKDMKVSRCSMRN